MLHRRVDAIRAKRTERLKELVTARASAASRALTTTMKDRKQLVFQRGNRTLKDDLGETTWNEEGLVAKSRA